MRRGIKFMDDRKQYYANSGDRYRHNEIRREKENHYVPRHRENFRYERRESPHDEEIIEDVDEGILYFSDCTMFPPRNYRERNLKPKRKRPEGCKTICIDGLPVSLVRIPKRLERILLEVFSANGGSIESVHISGKGICYIRFDKEESIEHAMSLSGYHMEVKQSYESVVRFRVVIDYAESQEDIEELESKQLIANRLNLNDTKVPTVPFFNSAAVDSLIVDLKNPEAYYDSVIILRYWMTTNLNRHTSDRFFNLLQVSSNQIKRLQSEKNLLGEEYNTLMQRYWSNLSRLDKEFSHLMSLYEDAHKKKVWDNFTKAQRKSITGWFETVRGMISVNGEEDLSSLRDSKKIIKNSGTNEKSNITEEGKGADHFSQMQQTVQCLQQQVWEMIGKLQTKDEELKEKQEIIDKLSSEDHLSVTPAKRARKQDFSFDPTIAKMICLLTTLLQAFPDGASTEFIHKYLNEDCKLTMSCEQIEEKLLHFDNIFSKYMTIENDVTVIKWKYMLLRG